jgi:succinyl-CoA synthetase beta subunit
MSLSIHEYQAKEIFRKYGIPLNLSQPASTAEEAFKAAQSLLKQQPQADIAVKAQVHAGGRGKGGGIKIVKTPEESRTITAGLLGKKLITPQTGPEGKLVSKILIEATSPIAKEFYTSIILDRSAELPCLILSEAGGMNIEEVAEKTPDKIVKKHFSFESGLTAADAKAVADKFIKDAAQAEVFAKTLEAMSKIFLDLDCELVEVNPLALMKNGSVIAIDAKINFDENALFRHPDMASLRDPSQEDPREVEAKKFDLSYVGLDGNIGCVVNGAGLAMATMDIIKYAGGEPANFLDVGGGAGKEKVTAAFKIILQDPKVEAILVNIFGGIMRCDVVAEGVLAAVNEVGVHVPIVVRLEGTNVKEGKEILKKSSLNIIAANTFAEAAEKVVAAVKKKK